MPLIGLDAKPESALASYLSCSSPLAQRSCQWKRARTWSLPSASVMLIGVHIGSVSSMTIEADADKVHALREQFSNIDGTSIIE